MKYLLKFHILSYFTEKKKKKKLLQSVWNHKRSTIVKTNLIKSKDEHLTLLNFKLYYESIVIKEYGTGIKTHRKMKQNREPRNKLQQIWAMNTQQGSQEHSLGKGYSVY